MALFFLVLLGFCRAEHFQSFGGSKAAIGTDSNQAAVRAEAATALGLLGKAAGMINQ